jgi:CubicO group peptidase (beta-lactamase class C family)
MEPDPAPRLRPTLEAAVRDGVTPGGVIAWIDGDGRLHQVPFGATAAIAEGGAPVTVDTHFDLASLTKPLATAALAMQALAAGKLDLGDPAHRYVAHLDRGPHRDIEIRHLLGHAAGFPAHQDFYLPLRAGDLAGQTSPREALVAMAARTELEAAPGRRALYSDLGYIVMGRILEEVFGRRLDAAFAENLAPNRAIGFRPVGETGAADPARVAPTEIDPERGGRVVGEVHDENAHAAGGVCGHAGLFGTAAAVAELGGAVAEAVAGRGGLFDPAVARELATSSAAPGTTWRLGWDTPSPPPACSHAGDLWPRTGIGHLGFTGTSLWLDPERGRAAAIITNRVYCGRDAGPIRELRRRVMDALSAT